MEKFRDQAVLLGQRKSLVGILTQPVVSTACTDDPMFVILNTGIIHRVGHHRMYVTLSRTLAEAGYAVLRFDFSGIGDSDVGTDGLPPLESCLAEIKEVLDWLEASRQARRIILMGLCSGADHAVLYAGSDPRIVGLVLLDPTLPWTRRHYLHYYSRRLLRLKSWLNAIQGRISLGTKLRELTARTLGRDLGASSTFEQAYQSTVNAGIPFLTVLTAEDARNTYGEQLFDAFPNVAFGELVRLEFLRDCDHTFSFESDRERLTRLVLNWTSNTRFLERDAVQRAPSPAFVRR
jgi:pimeloyl-ACP methyl ester carboxylesterase